MLSRIHNFISGINGVCRKAQRSLQSSSSSFILFMSFPAQTNAFICSKCFFMCALPTYHSALGSTIWLVFFLYFFYFMKISSKLMIPINRNLIHFIAYFSFCLLFFLRSWLFSFFFPILCISRHAPGTQEFVHSLSTLLRGTMEEKLRWTFQLYDINGDGFITREEMTDIAIAIYELMGRNPDVPSSGPDPDKIRNKVERVFTVSANWDLCNDESNVNTRLHVCC